MTPLFATDRTAAKLLDMPRQTFRALVEGGILPPPRKLGDQERWDVEALQRAARGEAATPDTVKW